MTDTTNKLRAVFLTALMIGSVFAAGIAFTGGAAAQAGNIDDGRSNALTSDAPDGTNKTVGPNSTVYQGETDLVFVNENGNTETAESLSRTGGSSEGVPLGMPISEDQTTGTYDLNGPTGGTGGLQVTVAEPSISNLEVQNEGGADVSGGVLTTNSDTATVHVQYNYYNAESVEISVEDEDGLDVTNEIVSSSEVNNGNGNAEFTIDPQAVSSGDYTISVSGVDDLDFGDASQSTTVTISSSRTASLNLASDEIVQGENLQYTAENSPEGSVHAVTIEDSSFRNGVDDATAENIFRNVGDTLASGVTDDHAWATIEIDGGNAVGSINTQYLEDASVDVELYPANSSTNDYIHSDNTVNATALAELEPDDDQSFDVTQGTVSLDSPTGAYVVGSEAVVNGTVSAGVDEVAIYARSNNNFQHVEIDGDNTIEVASDDTFEEEGVVLTQGAGDGNNLLSLPGTYRLGVISAEDADTDNSGTVDGELNTSAFNGGVSSVSSITVTDTELNGSFTTYNGQVAIEDGEVGVEGTAPGKDNLVVALVDQRGNAVAHVISVDNDGTFDDDSLSLGDLNEGSVSAHILSSGRDGVFGEDGAGPNTESELETYIESNWASGSSSGEQVREQILANTVDDTASDDLIVTEEFRLASALTTIESVSGVESGGTLTVEGQTNRQPDDNTITVELLDSDGDSVMLTSTEEWGMNGQWSVEMSLADVEPGEYTVESDDGETIDRQDVEIVEEVEETTQEPTTQEPTTQEPTTTEESTTAAPTTTEESAGTTEDTGGESGSGIPGFGMGIALIAVLGAALLALRQN
ncbi:HVO_2072 family ArtA-dependent S-layer glycoprotein [Halobacterium sp. CBA1126]|uniref:HVO_2072 family ArtA-dependent S-layer glycoprotein n=1 Tax=Halobacterium sp. CBA1126 TaxID=2668074 RepID=UPI0012FAF07D|nr:HVO_2072 family ArtA-dependent S-layer glycoprotein [Halobacterium sp. CBA1126]MUV59466.1 major cell surface glycoprotein [Halobacterium sp. CBA1126]